MNENESYYNGMAPGYNQLYGAEQKSKAKIMLKEIKKAKKKGLLLDIGGGTGIGTAVFTKYFDCIIIDPSEKLLEQGPADCAKILGTAEELPFAQKKFDVIISMTALHHTNIEESLDEIARVAKKDACIVLTYPKHATNLETFRKAFQKHFSKSREIEEEKDIIFLNN